MDQKYHYSILLKSSIEIAEQTSKSIDGSETSVLYKSQWMDKKHHYSIQKFNRNSGIVIKVNGWIRNITILYKSSIETAEQTSKSIDGSETSLFYTKVQQKQRNSHKSQQLDQKYHYSIQKFNRNIGIDFKVNSNPNPSPLPLPNDHYAHLTHINPNPNPGRRSIIINIRSIYKSQQIDQKRLQKSMEISEWSSKSKV